MDYIKAKLAAIAIENKVTLLYACETGSRGWGFPSPDSDYDVRFIYMHQPDWYMRLSDWKDHIEVMDDDLDITGWDLRKCLHLLKKSNAALIERFQSPVTYYENSAFAEKFRQLLPAYYCRAAVFHHPYGLAKKFRERIQDAEACKLKSWFYFVRSLLSCRFIRENTAVVPMNIQELLQYNPPEVNQLLDELIERKARVNEQFLYKVHPMLQNWTEKLWLEAEQAKQNMPAAKNSYQAIDDFFINTLYAEHHYTTGKR
jgi:predicted nucleotidyltransferase